MGRDRRHQAISEPLTRPDQSDQPPVGGRNALIQGVFCKLLRVGRAEDPAATCMYPGYLRFVLSQERSIGAHSLKVFKLKLVSLLRDGGSLAMPPGDVISGEYRVRDMGSVCSPNLHHKVDPLSN
jgi:hypothetical protein